MKLSMSRILILSCVGMLLGLAYLWATEFPITAPTPIAHEITRGPQDPSEIQYEKFMEGVRRLPPEPSSAAWILQQGSAAINFNTEIPVWSIIVGLITALIAFVSLREQMRNHIKNDGMNFLEIKGALKEIRRDVKRLAGLPHDEDED